MATSKLMLNKARQLNDGTYPLVMQLLHLRKKRVIYLGMYLYPDEFDEQTQQVVLSRLHFRRQKEIKQKKQIISEFTQRISDIINRLNQSSAPYTCDTIVDVFRLGDGNGSLVRYWQGKIDEQRMEGKFGIANAQQHTLRSVIRFAKQDCISIGSITPQFIHNYERYLHGKGVSLNTICYYMRNFKTIMNTLDKDGFAECRTSVLFEGIKTSPRKTVKRAISRDELWTLSQMEFDGEPLLKFARDMFMFSFYTRGMAFVDIAFLRQENLLGNILSYSRKKTGQFLQITINEPIQNIILQYSGVSHYLFPIVFSTDSEMCYKEYRSWLRRINKILKVIGKRLNLTIPLTTYVARHSWATQAKERGFPVSVISEGLGHCSENITQIYLKNFEHSVLDQANDVITNLANRQTV